MWLSGGGGRQRNGSGVLQGQPRVQWAGGERAGEEVRQPVAGPDKDGDFSSGGGRSHCRFMNMVVTGSNFKESFTEHDNWH